MGRDIDRWTPLVYRMCPVQKSIQYEGKEKKKLVTMKLDSSDKTEAEVEHFFEIYENEHVGVR